MSEHPNLYELLTTLFFICLRLNVCYFGSWWWCPLFYNREFMGPPASQAFNSLVFFPGTVAYVLYLLCQCREFGRQEAERRGSVLTLRLGSIAVWLVQGAAAAQQSPTGSCACCNFPSFCFFGLFLPSVDSLFHQTNATHVHQTLCSLVV